MTQDVARPPGERRGVEQVRSALAHAAHVADTPAAGCSAGVVTVLVDENFVLVRASSRRVV